MYNAHWHLFNRKKIGIAIDKFSKLEHAKIIKFKSTEDIKKQFHDILFFNGVPKFVVMDNEKSFNLATITFAMKHQLNIQIFKAPPYKSSVNGHIESFSPPFPKQWGALKQKKYTTLLRNY